MDKLCKRDKISTSGKKNNNPKPNKKSTTLGTNKNKKTDLN